MEKIDISSEILAESGFHLSGERTGYVVSDNILVFTTLEDQHWFLEDCIGGDHILYKIDIERKVVEKVDSYRMLAGNFKYKNALDWYRWRC